MACIKGVPHPFPYQGSKRQLASYILSCMPDGINVLYEPFAGSAAITIAAAYKNKARRYVINDLHTPIANLWNEIINNPERLCKKYESLWNAQKKQGRSYYDFIRTCFNEKGSSHHFLYLLARCVKGTVRYNRNGEFNNSPDNRRLGMKPENMRNNLANISAILKGRVTVCCNDYKEILAKSRKGDLIYMDPPYQGVCNVRNHRYCQSVDFDEFCEQLFLLNRKKIDFIVSYDGRTGNKVHGKELPSDLNLQRIELKVGRSAQATLLGRTDYTYESLYVSKSIADKRSILPSNYLEAEELPLFCGLP
ncbi:MAG: DNA adenine methylase [Planctomycetes bacterium]|nr:DNA adenine methylase [Planctomycetota bacterium]